MKRAYVTLVTNADFALGAKALIQSLRMTGTSADIVVMHTKGAPPDALSPLVDLGAKLIEVAHLPTSEDFNARHARKTLHDAAPFSKGNKPLFHTPLDNFCKLRLWELPYTDVVFLDADTLVLRNIDRLFSYPEFSAAPNLYENLADFHRLNSGVFCAKPSQTTFDEMLTRLDHPGAFWPRTDQTFLQHVFPNWHGLPITDNMLQYVWLNLPSLWNWTSINILHYQYEKPWQADHPKAHELRVLIDLWHQYASGVKPDLSAWPNPGDMA